MTRSGKVAQAGWNESVTRGEILALSKELCEEPNQRIEGGDVWLVNEVAMRLRAKSCDTGTPQGLLDAPGKK